MRDAGGVFFPWASFDKRAYDALIAWVFEGIAVSVERHGSWIRRWGDKPGRLADRLARAHADFPSWPKLGPVSGHRYLAVDPCRNNNPVFSIMGTDIIYYGANLAYYLLRESIPEAASNQPYPTVQTIEVWSDFAERVPGFYTFDPPDLERMPAIFRGTDAREPGPRPHLVVDLNVQQDGSIRIGGTNFPRMTRPTSRCVSSCGAHPRPISASSRETELQPKR
jgi:hypothetical protein